MIPTYCGGLFARFVVVLLLYFFENQKSSRTVVLIFFFNLRMTQFRSAYITIVVIPSKVCMYCFLIHNIKNLW